MDGEGCAFLLRRRNARAALSRLADVYEYGAVSAGGVTYGGRRSTVTDTGGTNAAHVFDGNLVFILLTFFGNSKPRPLRLVTPKEAVYVKVLLAHVLFLYHIPVLVTHGH